MAPGGLRDEKLVRCLHGEPSAGGKEMDKVTLELTGHFLAPVPSAARIDFVQGVSAKQ